MLWDLRTISHCPLVMPSPASSSGTVPFFTYTPLSPSLQWHFRGSTFLSMWATNAPAPMWSGRGEDIKVSRFFLLNRKKWMSPPAPTASTAPSQMPSEVKVATEQSGMLRQTAKHSVRLLNISHRQKQQGKKAIQRSIPHITVWPSRSPAGRVQLHLSEQPKKQRLTLKNSRQILWGRGIFV